MAKNKPIPPKLARKFLRWFLRDDLAEEVEGDLEEQFVLRAQKESLFKARLRYWYEVLSYLRPFALKYFSFSYFNHNMMFKHYFKISWRNLLKNRGYSLINIGGLALGMTVAMLIGLWIYDELSFNKYHKNYDDIAHVWGGRTDLETTTIEGSFFVQYPVGEVLRNNYPQYFKHVSRTFRIGDCMVSTEDKKFTRRGLFVEEDVLDILSLKILKGSYQSLNDPHSVILSESTAEAIFGDEEPMNQTLRIDNRLEVTVTGVYEDIPRNSSFSEIQVFFPWPLLMSYREWMKGSETDWDYQFVHVYVQLQPNTTMEAANAAIKDLYYKNVPEDLFTTIEKYKPFVQLIPMHTWHLYSEFENGKPAGGRITYVWLFGIVGVFVLLLACINFINLSTARSEKRAREVGVRKVVGSGKGQLIAQFLSESFMTVLLAFAVAVLLLVLLQNPFNALADKDIALPFDNPVFWSIAIAFIVLTGFVAGLYPAFYLSSFQPVKVLKGVLRIGRVAALPRKVLVVVQFTVSVVLIMGTLIVYQQIQYARNRPIGYDRESLITLEMIDPNYKGKQEVIRAELFNTGVVSEVATSSSPLTAVWNITGGYTWEGKDPNVNANFVICNVTHDFGKTVGWEIIAGRDFSRDFTTDSTDAVIINEAAVKYMGLKNPVGQELIDVDEFSRFKWSKTIIGVVKDIIMESPYEPVRPTLYYFNVNTSTLLHIKINPAVSASAALPKIEATLEKIVPTALFDYEFVDEEYARKFSQEERIGKLSGVFAVLAIFISCLGLFGLASYVAEQRTKEIGIRKVLGSSVIALWQMLSKDFLILVIFSCIIAIPLAYYVMHNWLQQYDYRIEISWWIFVTAGAGALAITLLTVSYQTIRAARMNPVQSLRTE